MERIPRISRAQSMDALSSQSNIAGYRAVIEAASHFGRFLPLMMTSAGSAKPARVVVLGAGVAGLQAIATARRLDVPVFALDVSPRAGVRELRRRDDHAARRIAAILEHTPNGVLLVDRETRIQYVNPSFRTMFHCGEEKLLGEPAAGFVHCDCFERAIAAGGNLMVKESIPDHDVSFRVGLFPIEGEDLYCGIFRRGR